MKALKTSLGILGLIVCLFLSLISCSKKDDVSPIKEKVTLKDVPDVIASRDDYSLLTQYPSFHGGDSAYLNFLNSHLTYPEAARQHHISGKVFVSFIVETDGRLSNLELLRGVDGLNDAVIDMIRDMPAWDPGNILGTPVRVKMILPYKFSLE